MHKLNLPDGICQLVTMIDTPSIVYFESIISQSIQILKNTMKSIKPTLFYAVKSASFSFLRNIKAKKYSRI